MNFEVTEKACRKCHQAIVDAIEGPVPEKNPLSCIRCHSTVGHLE
jgi:cytochrome c nitrite reductase small subunit